jgi:hypothetical protein
MPLSIEAISSLVGATASLVAAISTIAIAVLVHRFSAQSAKQQVVQTINSHFKAFSYAAFTDQDFAEFVQRKHIAHHPVDFVRDLYVVYYRLSLLDDIFSAQKTGLLPDAMERYEFDEWIQALVHQSPEALIHALNATPRGFSPAFVAHVKSKIGNLEVLSHRQDRD